MMLERTLRNSQGRPGLPGGRGTSGRKGMAGAPGELGVSIKGVRGEMGPPGTGKPDVGNPGFRVSRRFKKVGIYLLFNKNDFHYCTIQ